MSKKTELLRLMVKLKDGENVIPFYDTKSYGFYDFMQELKLEKEEYEILLKDLLIEDCIEIEMKGGKGFGQAIIRAKKEALRYLSGYEGR